MQHTGNKMQAVKKQPAKKLHKFVYFSMRFARANSACVICAPLFSTFLKYMAGI